MTDHQAARRSAMFIVSRFAAMVTALVLVGLFITYPSPTAAVRRWDLSINERLAVDRSDWVVSIARFVSRSGDTFSVLAIAAVIAIGLAVARRWRMMAFIPVALLIEVSTFGAVNYLVRRPRPDVVTVGSVPSTFSYPSGHVAATLVCWLGTVWLLLELSRRKPAWVVAVFGIAAVSAMAWARVYLGAHHVLDVVAGVAMGVGSVLVAAKAFGLASDGDEDPDHFTVPDAAPDDDAGLPGHGYRGRHRARTEVTSA